jgi:hypothetical protein
MFHQTWHQAHHRVQQLRQEAQRVQQLKASQASTSINAAASNQPLTIDLSIKRLGHAH